jgi:hypothetical protein
MMLPALFCIFTLAIVGCSGIEVTTPRSNPSGLYVEEDEFDLSNLVGTEEIQLLQDGTGVSRRKFGATSPAIRVLRDSRIRLTTTRESGNKVYVLEFKGKWKLRGDKIFYQDDKARIDHIGDFFLAVFNPKEPRSSLSARHVFSIDSNGDLLRIPPRGHPYYAGKFVKQK